ncbi:MAG: hypothetical protein NPIRA01_10300 [Nitrospirales bacterium]|nr:MAG: hypothetical protein NPIRA01_10300 [Nitrospirales bacterium]
MTTIQKSLRMPKEMAKPIEEMAKASGRDFSSMVNELVGEAVKMRRCPGIIFVDGPSGRRAHLAGTGLEIWEIIATYNSLNHDDARLTKAYHWLQPTQVRAALGYYTAYPQEIDELISSNEQWTKKHLATQHPSLAINRT